MLIVYMMRVNMRALVAHFRAQNPFVLMEHPG